jgi:hypothetical protein
MKRLSTIIISAVFLMVTMSGCAPVAITGKVKTQQDAFGAKKEFAVVTIASIKELHENSQKIEALQACTRKQSAQKQGL